MREKGKEKFKAIMFLAVLMLIPLFGLVRYLGIDGFSHFNAERLMREQNTTVATIAEVVRDRPIGANERGTGAIIELEYEVGGVMYRVRRNVPETTENREGEELEIYYDYRNPENIILVDRERDFPPFGLGSILLSSMAMMMLLFLIRMFIGVMRD